MLKERAIQRKQSLAYNFFILALTLLALAFWLVMLLPINASTFALLQFYDNLICVIFLIDFFITLRAAPSRSEYFFKQHGWLDLLGSIPTFGVVFPNLGFLRLARISRLARIFRLLRGMNKKELIRDVIEDRSRYAIFVTLLTAIIVLTVASVLVLLFESQSPEAKIRTGGESLWYSIVTIATVGYGDFSPVTVGGRITASFIMVAGIGIIGALASILSSILIGRSSSREEEDNLHSPPVPTIEQELTDIKTELALLHQLLDKMGADGGKKT